jgi:signal transduction histidine kinase
MTQKEDKVQILIRDNGTGIEEKIINKIFDPFFTTKTTGEASGVGLYLSREIIQNYGGDITVTSEKNEYTEFSIILPILK